MDKITKTRVSIALLAACMLLLGAAAEGAETRKPVPAPEFKVKLATGQEATLGTFRGRPLVISIGASWCPHCQHDMPILARVYDEHKGEIEMLVVFVKSPRKDVDKLVAKSGLKAKVGMDPDMVMGRAFGVNGIPVTFFIDSEGRMVDEHFGSIEEGELMKKIDEITGEKKAPPAR